MSPKVETDDLLDAQGVADVLGLAADVVEFFVERVVGGEDVAGHQVHDPAFGPTMEVGDQRLGVPDGPRPPVRR